MCVHINNVCTANLTWVSNIEKHKGKAHGSFAYDFSKKGVLFAYNLIERTSVSFSFLLYWVATIRRLPKLSGLFLCQKNPIKIGLFSERAWTIQGTTNVFKYKFLTRNIAPLEQNQRPVYQGSFSKEPYQNRALFRKSLDNSRDYKSLPLLEGHPHKGDTQLPKQSVKKLSPLYLSRSPPVLSLVFSLSLSRNISLFLLLSLSPSLLLSFSPSLDLSFSLYSVQETRNYLNNAPNKPLHDIYEHVFGTHLPL